MKTAFLHIAALILLAAMLAAGALAVFFAWAFSFGLAGLALAAMAAACTSAVRAFNAATIAA